MDIVNDGWALGVIVAFILIALAFGGWRAGWFSGLIGEQQPGRQVRFTKISGRGEFLCCSSLREESSRSRMHRASHSCDRAGRANWPRRWLGRSGPFFAELQCEI